jgi:Domain of unknown function DUF11
MKMFSLFHSPHNATQNDMETNMKPQKPAWRPGRWLMAAAMALGIGAPQANAQGVAKPAENLIIEQLQKLEKRPGAEGEREPRPDASVIFTKTGRQIDCDYVVYTIRFGLRANPDIWAAPAMKALLSGIKLDLKDQLPAGLSIISTSIVGDVTDAGGVNPPSSATSTTATTDDTMTMADFRLSADDLNGDGSATDRYADIRITAKIDRAAFPAVAQVLNQAQLNASIAGGGPGGGLFVSHDPALPDDGDDSTGEKTKITIDVTKCDPPGGGDKPEEACFKVEQGEVECGKPGDGTYTYNMTVGADMAGKVIELSTTTPGVVINPPAQVVPAGGGVLAWTITGASPGDTIHLVVIGTEIFTGPEEGWGLCCTQTIDITIPEDLDCPDEKEPDLKVEKKADVERCTIAGGCKFTIRVTNVGDAPYNGPIVLNEVTVPGNGTIDSGPNGLWACAPLTSPMLCKHPATTLNPGEFVELTLGFKPGPGWIAPFIENCARYNYNESGKPLFGSQLNDFACARIPLCDPNGTTIYDKQCQPPVEKKADLQIRKIAREFCTADGLCLYGITVTNVGTVTHNGPLTVVDNFPGGAPTSVTFAPTPPWACATINPSQFQCDHPGIVLAPGASTAILVRAIVPLDYKDGKVENCAKVNPIAAETNLANNKACATAKLRQPDGRPVMKIEKTCSPGISGAAIFCTITVTNTGTAAPVGPVHVNDAAAMLSGGAPVNIQTVTPDGPEWSCSAVPAANLACQIPGAVMTPGTSRRFTAALAASPNGRWKNCARGNYGPAPGNDIVYPIGEACAEGGVDIVVKKTGDAQCEAGKPCAFTITISNNGSSDFSGPVQIGDAVEIEGIGRLEGVEIQSIAPPFGCAPEPAALPFGCTAGIKIAAGESQAHVVTIVIPDNDALANVPPNGVSGRNCVGVTGDKVKIGVAGQSAASQTNGSEGGAFACHPFTLVKKQDDKQCSQGFVKNAAGRCVCPEGTRFSQGRGRCVGDVTDPVEPEQPDGQQVTPKCELLPGMIRTKDNRCICPRDTELRSGACKKPVADPQCRLLPGQIRTKNGNCICPQGTELRDGACRKPVPPQCKLLPGQIRTKDNRCICPSSTVLKNARSVPKIRQCTLLSGQIRTSDGRCVCPRGTVLGRKGCANIEPPAVQCKIPGQVKGRNGQCFCPRGTKLIDGECLRPINDTPEVKRCPRGTIGIYPVCIKPEVIQPRGCPRGTVGDFPNCYKPKQQEPGIILRNRNSLQLLDPQQDIR